ncbi:MAG: hypothetical protein JSS20_19970 [Proteobacteria bacterium]|nr:hypothetical protein [Pseudomonadota bacterium]
MDGVAYRLHRLASRGYCAELGRYREDDWGTIRLHHPDKRLPELRLDADGTLLNFGENDPEIEARNEEDRARFEQFVAKLPRRAIGFKSRFVWEAVLQAYSFAFFYVIPAVIAFGIWLAWRLHTGP